MSEDAFCLQVAIDGRSDGVKNFSRMLGCLDRFGKELFFEFNNDEVRESITPGCHSFSSQPHMQVTLRTINTAQSAYVHFTLGAAFFQDWHPQRGRSVSIKLHLKNMVSIFRSPSGVETVWLQLAVDNECYLRVHLMCKNGVSKMFDLKFEEVPPPMQTLSW